jgi:hypothetical protein
MNSYVFIIIILILLAYRTNNDIREYFTSEHMISSIDQRKYKIVSELDNKKGAANRMALSHMFVIEFLRHMRTKYIINKHKPHNKTHQETQHNQKIAQLILQNYNPDNIFENHPKPGEDTSFVTNKGDEFGICLREKKTGNNEFHDISTMQFVLLHEMAHLGTESYGHGYEFWATMKILITEAYEAGLHTPINYAVYPQSYCGLPIEFNPYFNTDLNIIF